MSETVTDTTKVPPTGLFSRIALLSLCLCVVVVLDQATKALIMERFEHREIVPIIDGVFNLTLVFNRGAAFGMLSGLSDGPRHLILALTTLAALAVVLYFLYSDYRNDLMAHGAAGLILGGAIGNIIDRISLGEVIDFLDVYYGTYHWPAFNVADSAICVGVAVLVLKGLGPRK